MIPNLTPSEWDWDLIIWPLWLGTFLVLELLGIFRKVPWTSLSRFAWKLDSLHWSVPWIFLVGLSLLLVHIVTGFPQYKG